MSKKYTSVFAQENHLSIGSVSEIKKGYSSSSLFLFLNGKTEIGSGYLYRFGNNSVNTDGVALRRGYRKKGHGIHLYFALIEAAKKIGATRIYSSTRLNKFSRRMWNVKLRKFFTVRELQVCKNACVHCKKKNRYWIDLRGEK